MQVDRELGVKWKALCPLVYWAQDRSGHSRIQIECTWNSSLCIDVNSMFRSLYVGFLVPGKDLFRLKTGCADLSSCAPTSVLYLLTIP